MDFLLSYSWRKTMKIFKTIRFRVYFKPSVEHFLIKSVNFSKNLNLLIVNGSAMINQAIT